MPCEISDEGEPPEVWSHWWHSERWAQFDGRTPDDLTAKEIVALVRAWQATSLGDCLVYTHVCRHNEAGFLYLIEPDFPGGVKVGISRDPQNRAAWLRGALYCSWFVGTGAIPIEQTLLALLAPWALGGWPEIVKLEPEPIARLVSLMLEGLPWRRDEPEGWTGWKFRRRMQWSWPFWERVLEMGMPATMAEPFAEFWEDFAPERA